MAMTGELFKKLQTGYKNKNVGEVIEAINTFASQEKLYKGAPPLYVACGLGFLLITKFLIEEGKADINQPFEASDDQFTPLMIACKNGHKKIVDYLIKHPNLQPNKPLSEGRGNTALHMACIFESDIEIIKSLLSHPDLDVSTTSYKGERPGSTPLVSAITHKRFDIASLILNDSRFKANSSLIGGKTELHHIIESDYPNEELRREHIEKLVAAGADPSVRKDMSHLRSRDNCNAIEFAKDRNLPQIAEYLEKVRLNLSKDTYRNLRLKSDLTASRIFETQESAIEHLNCMLATLGRPSYAG